MSADRTGGPTWRESQHVLSRDRPRGHPRGNGARRPYDCGRGHRHGRRRARQERLCVLATAVPHAGEKHVHGKTKARQLHHKRRLQHLAAPPLSLMVIHEVKEHAW